MSSAKRVLILGNGFDLAHGLPTKYEHFLEFAKRALIIYTYADNGSGGSYESRYIEPWDNGNDFIKDELRKAFNSRTRKTENRVPSYNTIYSVNLRLDTFKDYLLSNIWYKYIFDLYMDGKMQGKNWIDFESEISFIIQFCDFAHESLEEPYFSFHKKFLRGELADRTGGKSVAFYEACDKCLLYKQGDSFSVRDFRKQLYEDLEKLILAFEIYLTDYVEKIPITTKVKAIEDIKPDYVMTFNYTRTYERHYISKSDNVKVCHIHGVCDENRATEDNDMVLGIDEYYHDLSEIMGNTDFAIFRKYIQRIRKKTDTSYADWVREINGVYDNAGDVWHCPPEEIKNYYPDRVSEVWSYGHSLDVTDKDILQKFMESEATAVHVFSYDKPDEGELISKLLAFVDYNIVIAKSTASPRRLEFLPMNPK